MVAQYIVTRQILDLCEAAETKQGARVGIRWWEQMVLDMERARDMAATTTEAENYGLEE